MNNELMIEAAEAITGMLKAMADTIAGQGRAIGRLQNERAAMGQLADRVAELAGRIEVFITNQAALAARLDALERGHRQPKASPPSFN